MISMETIPIKRDSFSSRAIDDETIIVNDQGDRLHTLNRTGSFIWKQIDGEASLGKILENLCAEYDVPPRSAEDDLLKYIGELAEKGIVHFKE